MKMTDPNTPPDDLQTALRGLDYPATRSKLVTVALQNGASRAIIDRILELPETADFVDEDALERVFGVRVPGAHPEGWQ
jgi:hypothetical protein